MFVYFKINIPNYCSVLEFHILKTLYKVPQDDKMKKKREINCYIILLIVYS